MDMLIPVLLSIACGAGAIGYILAIYLEMREARAALHERAKDFDAVSQAASSSNLSLGEKILQMDERLGSLEHKITAQTIQNHAPNLGWKK